MTPLLVYLARRQARHAAATPLGGYLRALLITIFVSLLFDYYDVYLYLSGTRIEA